jgi:hypothetical protein
VNPPEDLWRGLIDDAAMFPPANTGVAEAVAAHLGYRQAWFRDLIGPLVVSDQQLAAAGRAAEGGAGPLAVSVITTGGAGGLVSLAHREVAGVRVVAVESALRDLDDLAGNAARVASAAAELDEDVRVFVEIPHAPGWERAVAEVEAAGLFGKIRTGSPDNSGTPSYAQLAEQLSVLVEADLAFKATAGLHHAQPTPGSDPDQPVQHGFLNLLAAVDALVEGVSVPEAAEVLRNADPSRIGGWNEPTAVRVRRRFLSFGCCGVLDPVGDLVALGLVEKPA